MLDYTSSTTRRAAGLGLILCLVLAVGSVLIPVWLIRPFSPQTEPMLALSWALRRWAPLTTAVVLLVALGLGVGLWRGKRGVAGRLATTVAVLLVGVASWFARQNHFEWMFAPLPNAQFVRAADADFVAPDDIVLAVTLNGDPVAYPVRQVSYHHVVHDSVGGVPIIATY